MIEELDDVAEDLADKLGIYSEERSLWTSVFKRRIHDCAEFRTHPPLAVAQPAQPTAEEKHIPSADSSVKGPFLRCSCGWQEYLEGEETWESHLPAAPATGEWDFSTDAKREGYLLGWKTLADMIRAHFPEFDDAHIAVWADKLNATIAHVSRDAAQTGSEKKT